MSVKKEQLNPTSVKLTIAADPATLAEVKNITLRRLPKQVKLPGFRTGKAPLSLVEKQANHAQLQSEFLDEAVNRLYGVAIQDERLRPIQQPNVTVTKFVPFTALEFTAEIEVVGDVTLGDYTKIRLAKKPVTVTEKDIDDVVHSLQLRLAERSDVDRASKQGDQVVIDFTGKDAKTNEPISGADGKSYPLILGSNTFIPGFEENIVGLKADEQKTFTITFPKDYGVKALQSRKVVFEVRVTKVQEVVEPKVDDAFAAKAGPFKSLRELRDDIKKQLLVEKQSAADKEYENDLLGKITDDSTVIIPSVLIDEEVRRSEQQIRQNLAYRGQTWQEYLAELEQSEEEYHASLRSPAERRVKAGLVLTEIADREKVVVTPEEFEIRLQMLKGQYTDAKMRAELEKVENQRSIMSNMLSEKTIAKLTVYARKPAS